MSTRNMQGVVSPIIPASIAGGSNYSGVYTLDQLNRLNAVYPNHIGNSLRFRSSASAYLNRTPSTAGNRQTWTWSGWVKRGTLSAQGSIFQAGNVSADHTAIYFRGDNFIDFYNRIGATEGLVTTNPIYRDPSAWYHFVFVYDATNATAANRMLVYVNGVAQSLTVTTTLPQNTNSSVDNNVAHYIGILSNGGAALDGYLAEINFIDGQALTPSAFGKFYYETGVWQPTKYSGTYGTNGFYLKFSDTTSTTTLCYDYSGNGNNWTTNNISLTSGSTYDSILDSPTNYDNGGNGVGNYCVMNAVSIGSDCTLSNGNLGIAYGSSATRNCTMGTIGMSSGKWYCEFSYTSGSTPSPIIGLSSKASSTDMPNYIGYNAYGWGYFNDGTKYTNATSSAYGATWTTNDIIGIAFDADAGTLTFYKNGTTQGTAFTGLTSGPYYFGVGDGGATGTYTGWINFGQRPFAFSPPSGYKSLCTYNLP